MNSKRATDTSMLHRGVVTKLSGPTALSISTSTQDYKKTIKTTAK